MPVSSEIVQKLSADNSQYRSVMNQSELVADKVGKSILKKLDLRAGVTVIAAAIGFNLQSIAESVARTITGVTKQEEEDLKRLADLSEELTNKTIARNREKLSQEKQLSALQMDRDRIQSNIDANPYSDTASQAKRAADRIALLEKEKEIETQLGKIREANDKRSAEREAFTKTMDDEFARNRKEDREETQRMDENQERYREDAARQEKRRLAEIGAEDLKWYKERVSLDQQLRAQKLETLKPEERIAMLSKEVAGWKQQQAKADKDSNEYKSLQVKINDNNLDIEKEQKAVAEAKLKTEVAITEEKREQIAIGSTGRGDTQLSDREIERKIAQIQSQLSTRGATTGSQYQGSVAGYGSGNDLLGESLKGSLAQARAELDFRNNVRSTARTRGEDAALRAFPGISEQRLREILETAPGTRDVVDELKKLNGHLQQGVRTVLSTDEGGG